MSSAVAQDAIAAARDLLPAWTIWGNDVVFVAASVLLSAVMTQLGTWIAVRPCRESQHREWFEQARLAFPARRVVATAGLLFPLLIVTWGFLMRHELSPFPRPVLSILTALIATLPMFPIYRQVDIQAGSEAVSLRVAIRSVAARVILLMPHLAIALPVMTVMPDRFDNKALILLALTAILATFFVAGGNLFAAGLVGLAHPASARLTEITAQSAARTGVNLRGVYEVDWRMVNALAFPLAKRLAFTRRAVETLTDEELEAICAHELGHLAESLPVHAFRLFAAVAAALFFPAIIPTAGSFGIIGAAVLLIGFLALNYSFAGVSRRMEKRADAVATAVEPTNIAYAKALEHLYCLNLLPAVTGLKCQTHPDLYDRLVASGVQPDFPRPPLPSRRRVMAALLVMLAPIPFMAAGYVAIIESLNTDAVPREATVHLALLLPTDEAMCLYELGRARDAAGEFGQAIIFLRAASTINESEWLYPAYLARAFLSAEYCEDAANALRDARARKSKTENSADGDPWFREVEEAIEECREHRMKPRRDRGQSGLSKI